MRLKSTLILLLVCNITLGQLTVTQVDENTAADLLTGEGVIWNSVNHSGGADQLAAFEIGTVNPIGLPDIQGYDGIVLTTGIYTVVGSGNTGNGNSTTPQAQGSSAPLFNEHNSVNHNDATELEISFYATATSVQFQIVFASEEYLEEVGSPFQDVMGVYMQGTGLNPDYAGYENVSLIPSTGDFVSIDNVNNNTNSSWYVNNPYPSNPYPIEYDGFTVPMTINVDGLVCGELYRLVFAVSDVDDNLKDSAILISANSIKSSFNVDNLTIVGPQPFCEGDDITAFVNNNPNWQYDWDDGQSGMGLNNITTSAVLGDGSISVTVTDPDGCQQVRSGTIEVHTNNNQPPQLLNPVEKLYVQMWDTVCYDFYSTDAANEEVFMDFIGVPSNNFYFSDNFIIGNNPNHENREFCFSMLNFNEYGEHTIQVKLTDENACGQSTVLYPFIVDVLCPSCPECLEINHRDADFLPFFDGVIDAARCLEIGVVELPAGHGVNTEDHAVEFKAGESITFGPGFQGGSNWSAQITGTSCSNQCTDCCTYTSQLTYDAPVDPYLLTPNNDGFNDIFFVTDFSNPYSAYNATRWHLSIWKKNILNWYHSGNKIWNQESIGLIDHPFDVCFGYETPTDINPYNTFWWDGTHGLGNNIGDPVNEGTYVYHMDFDGCQLNSSGINDPTGHSLDYWGEIIVVYPSMAPVGGGDEGGDFELQEIESEISALQRGDPSILAFPNPTSGYLQIQIANFGDETVQLDVYDVSGKRVLTTNSLELTVELDLSNLQKGMYQLKVWNASHEQYKKIIVQ